MRALWSSPIWRGGRTAAAVVLATAYTAVAAKSQSKTKPVEPFEREGAFGKVTALDRLVGYKLRAKRIRPARPCSDEVFLRRVFLDMTGTLPTYQEAETFLKDKRPGKRAALIERLFEREEFADYWSLKWCDLLRVKAEFPINLWPNAVQAYQRWIRDCIRDNTPYDEFARALLTSTGSNFRVPPVNFYRAIQGQEPSTIAAAVALTFMGARVEKWPAARRAELEAFFSRVAFKKTAEWKEEIVYLDPATTTAPLDCVFIDGSRTTVQPGEDPRLAFADWLIQPRNRWFGRNIVNRMWSWFMGRGIIHEPDDLGPGNTPANPKLLAYLEKELVKADYDLRHVYRLILNSATYQQSSIPRSQHPDTEALFAVYPVRRLDAEVLIDALCFLFGGGEGYSSQIPEPFTFIPDRQRTIALADGSITSQFLEMFGRPSRDTGLESERSNKPTDAQRLHLLNSTHVQSKIERSQRLSKLMRLAKGKRPVLIRTLYLSVLSRYPSARELRVAEKYLGAPGMNQRQGVCDLAWALVNTKEFLYRH